ncbi:MAG: DUF6600 domain-containing protein [Ignavibacteriaceae bacterium]
MKKLLIAALFLIFGLSTQIKADSSLLFGGEFGFFYSSLAPYGSWIQINGGENVWHPDNVGYGWSPYHYGHWVWTNDGWYWDSDEPFGDIVYHYGRWYNDESYGWIWVPDYQWAPAWVEWRYDNNYIGWAPLPPYASFSVNFGIRFTSSYYTPYQYYSFVSYRYMCNPHVYNYYLDNNFKYRIYSSTKYRTNYGFSDGRVINRGVDVDYVRQRSGDRIVESRIQGVSNIRNAETGRNSNSTVRALILQKDQIDRSTGRSFRIQKTNRPSSLDVSRLAVGNRNDINRSPNLENRNSSNAIQNDRINSWNNNNRMQGNNYSRPLNNRPNNYSNPNGIPGKNFDRQIPKSIAPRDNARYFNKQNRNGFNSKPYTNNPQIRREIPQRNSPQIQRNNAGRNEGNRGGNIRGNSNNRWHR